MPNEKGFLKKAPMSAFFKNTQKTRLTKLEIELTERCNNACIHCYINLPANDKKSKKKEISTRRIKSILKESVELGCIEVLLTGGEPLLRKDFEEIYLFAKRQGLYVSVFTNATLITSKLAKTFKKFPPKAIQITIYGMSKETYGEVTGKPRLFDDAMRGVKLLQKYNVPFTVKAALLPPFKKDIKKFEKWAKTLPAMNDVPDYCMFYVLRSNRDNEAKNELIKKLRVPLKSGLKMFSRKEHFKKLWKEYCGEYIGPPGEKLFSCGTGVTDGSIDAYGKLRMCIYLRHPEMVYDLKKGSLQDAYTNFFPKIRKIKAKNKLYLERCAKCFLKGLCEQCPAKSWAEYGTLDTPVEYFCIIAHDMAQYLGLIKKGEKAWEVKNWKSRIKKFAGNKKGANNEKKDRLKSSVCNFR